MKYASSWCAFALFGLISSACSTSSSNGPAAVQDAGPGLYNASCKGPQPPIASCSSATPNDAAPGSECIEFNGSMSDFVANSADGGGIVLACQSAGGTLSMSGCSTANSLGRCVMLCGTPQESTFYFYPSSTFSSASEAQQACTQMQGAFFK